MVRAVGEAGCSDLQRCYHGHSAMVEPCVTCARNLHGVSRVLEAR